MELREVILASLLVSFIIAQNYVLYALPITLTYSVMYMITKSIKTKNIARMSIIAFIIVKNIIYMALPLTILADVIGLLSILEIMYIKVKEGFSFMRILKYILITIFIVFHILLLDFSYAVLLGNVLVGMVAMMSTSVIVYIYAPLSIFIIIALDGFDFVTEDLKRDIL